MILTTRRLFTALFFLALVTLTTRNVTDPDFGWHLRTGEYIATTRAIPHTDFFSHTATGQPWITHEWLVQVAMYWLDLLGGLGALTLFFAVIATLTFVLVYLRCPGKPYLAAFVVLLAAVTAAPFWGARPHTLSLLFVSVFLFLLDDYQRAGANRKLLWLLPVMLVWANSHGSFALGPALIGVYLAGDVAEKILRWHSTPRQWRDPVQLAGILLACLALIVVNPNGARLYTYPLETLTSHSIQTYIQEWQSPDFTSIAAQPFLVMLIATFGALGLARQRVGLAQIVLLIGFAIFGLRAARQISIWVLIAAPMLAAATNHLIASRRWTLNPVSSPPTRTLQSINWGLLGVFAFAAMVRIAGVIIDQPNAERAHFPIEAVNFIEQNKLTGPIFNQYNWGGYLIWRLYPRERVFIDGRSDVYGLIEDSVVKAYLTTYTGAADWREPLDRYHVRMVLIEPDAPVVAQLSRDPAWKKLYEDRQAIIYFR
jgi:hypothetical protein